MDKPEYLAEQLAIAELRVQTTTGTEREEWKRRVDELEKRVAALLALRSSARPGWRNW